jgi:hypothetical protein
MIEEIKVIKTLINLIHVVQENYSYIWDSKWIVLDSLNFKQRTTSSIILGSI